MRENEALGAAFQEDEFADYIGLTYDQIAARLQEVDKGGRRAVCALQAMLDLLKPASWSAQQVLEVAMEHPDFDRSDVEADMEKMEMEEREKKKMEMEEREKKKMEMEEREKRKKEMEEEKMEMEEREKKKMEMEEEKMEMEEREKKKMELEEREKKKMELEEREKKQMEMEERENVEGKKVERVVIDVEAEPPLPGPIKAPWSIWKRRVETQAKARPQPEVQSYWGKWKRSLSSAWWGDAKRSRGEEKKEKGWEEKTEKKEWEGWGHGSGWHEVKKKRWGQGSGWQAGEEKQGDGGHGKGYKGYGTGNGNGWGAEGGGKGQGKSKGKGKAQRWAPKPPWAHAKRQDRGAHGGHGGRDRWGGRYVPGGYEDGDGIFYPHLAEIHGSIVNGFMCLVVGSWHRGRLHV